MRFVAAGIAILVAASLSASAATGKILKVLPQFLDTKGRNSLSPSLYERDAYQVVLREHPERRSAMRFYVEWKGKGTPSTPFVVRIELRGIAEQGNLPKEMVLEEAAIPKGWLSHWTAVTMTAAQYKTLGEVTAWRATLWEGKQMVSSQQSFLW